MEAEDIKKKIIAKIPDARITLEDLTGTKDHWKAHIVSEVFRGKKLLERHRIIMATLEAEMMGPIHALTMDLKTPDEVK